MRPARLALVDGTIFDGQAFGAPRQQGGEVVFNTALTGYEEVVTDPSYAGQLVVMTTPHIGNVGWNDEDLESLTPRALGLIIRDASPMVSNWRSTTTLSAALERLGVVGLAGIDTRPLTRKLRDGGAQNGLVSEDASLSDDELVAHARALPSMEGRDLVSEVTCGAPYEFATRSWRHADDPAPTGTATTPRRKIVAYDFGIKRNILCGLYDAGFDVTVVPANTPAADVLARSPDGVFLSNGPGDPAAVPYAVDACRALLAADMPLFGICLGHQLLGLALGGTTYKLKFGHHGANQPVRDLQTGKVEITSQNHGFAVDVASLGGKAELTHVNLNDGTVEGMRLPGRPVFSVQYHPEASPGPHDSHYLFARFARVIDEHRGVL